MDFCSMKRKELQTLCKKNGIPANLSNVEMATRLAGIRKVKQQKMFKSCLKNLQIVVSSDDENDRVKIRGRKRVKFSPENETFEFEKTDPRELRLLARKRRSMAKSELAKNPVLVSENLRNVEGSVGNLVAECEEVGTIEEAAGRNLRRKSVLKSNAVFVSQDLTNVENVEKGNKERSSRYRSRKVEQKNVEITLLSPCVEKKAKRGRKYDEIAEGGVVGRVDRPPDKIADPPDHIGNTHMVTRRSLRSRGITAENLVNSAAGVLERSKLVENDLNKKGENILQFPRRSVRHSEKPKGGDLTSVSEGNAGDKLSNEDAAQNHTENCVETASDSRKRTRAQKKAASGKNQSFEEVSHGYVDQQNGNMEKPVNDKAFVSRRLRSRQVVSEGLDKDVGEVKILVDGHLTRKSIRRRAKNDEKDESSIPAEAARQFTRPRGKVKVNASLSVQLADDVPQSADIMCQSDNQRAQLVNKESEERDGLLGKATAVMADGSSSEQTMPDGPGEDHSIEEKINNKVEEQYHATLGFASSEQKTEKSDVDIHIGTSSPKQLCVAYDTRRPEDHIGSNDSDEKPPANVRADTCSTARSDCPVPPLLQKSSDCEAECSAQVNNNLDQVDGPLRLHVAAVNDFQEGIISTSGSISASKFSVPLAAKNFADVSETVFHSPAKPVTPVERAVFNADYKPSFSGTDLGDGKVGSEKVTSNKRDRLFNPNRNEKLSKQINRLEEFSVENEENKSENAIKNQMLDDARNIDEQVIDQGEAAGTRERYEIVSRKTECTTPEVFRGQGLNWSASQVKGLVGGEVNSEVNAQHSSALDRSTLSAGALLANIRELTEEDEETKTVTPSYNRVGGTTSRSTDEGKMDESENKYGCEDMSLSSIVGNNLYLQSQVEGDFTVALSLLKKGEESPKQMLEDVACFQKRGYELECTVENSDVLHCKSAMVNETVSKLFTDDIHNASENPGERKLVDAATISGTGCEGLCSIPFSVLYQELDYESVKINCDMDRAEAKDSVCPIALKPQAVVHNEKVTNEIEEPMQDALQVRCLPSLDDCVGTNNVNVAPEETKHWEVNNSEDACITKSPGNLRRSPYGEVNNSEDARITKSPGNLQQSPCVFAEVSDALIDPGMCNSEEIEFARDQANRKKERESVNGELLGSHVHNVDKAAFLIANDHLASERPEDLQRSTSGLDGVHFALGLVELEENGSQACGVDIEELRASKSMSPEVHDDKGNELDFTRDKLIALACKLTSADEKPLEAKMNDMHDIPTDAGDQKLSEATNIREMGYHVICSSLSSLINGETYYVHAKGDHNADKTEAQDIVCHAVLESLSFGRNEKPIHEIEGTLRDASEIGCALLLEDFLAKSKDDAALKERELGVVKSSEIACMSKSDDSASERQHDLRSSSCGMADVSDVIDHGKMDTSKEMEVDAEIDYEHVKSNYDADQAVMHDVFYHAIFESQSFGENEKAVDQTGQSLHDASENGCAPLLVDSHGIGKDNVASKESEICKVRNSGDACMTNSDHLASERQKDLLRSSSRTAEVSNVVMDHGKVDNSEAVDANSDQGNSTIGQQNMNGGQLDVPLQEKASATERDHLEFKVSMDLQSSLCGDDGICSVQHSDYKENGCLAKVEEQQLCESVAVINHCDAEGVGGNSAMVDEKTLQVLMNSIHGTTEIFSEKELVEAATIREVGCGDLHSSPFSIVNWEANTEGARSGADQGGTKDILHPAMVELEPQLSGGYEKVTERIEEASEDTSAVRSSPLIDGFSGTSKLDVVLKENEHGEVHSLEHDSLIGSDGLASEKPEDLHSASCEIAEVSDVIEHGKSNSSEVVTGADQGHIVVSMKRVVEILPPSQLINSGNSGALSDLHGNTGSPGDHKLFDAVEVNEMAQKAVSNYPCSTPNLETSYESFKGNSEPALETLQEDRTPVDMHDHPFFKMPENEEVHFKDLEDRCLNTVDHSVAENYSIVKSKEGDHAKVNPVEFDEMCHFAVNHFSNLSEMGTKSILGGRDNNDDNSNKAGTFSPSPCAFDNVTDTLQDQNASPSMSGSQQRQSAESVSAAHAGSTAFLECKNQKSNLDSCMFSSWEIDLIWGNITANNNSGNMQQPVTEHIVSGKELADGHFSCPTHCRTEEIEERNGTEHEVADDQTVNQEIQPAEEQLIELKFLLNSSRENPDYPGGKMNETSRAGEHPNCPHNAKNSGEVPHNAKDFHAINHADSKVTKSSMIKSKKSRSILIDGTPQKPPLFIHGMKENTQAPKARQMIDVTAVKPLLKRKALEDLQK